MNENCATISDGISDKSIALWEMFAQIFPRHIHSMDHFVFDFLNFWMGHIYLKGSVLKSVTKMRFLINLNALLTYRRKARIQTSKNLKDVRHTVLF